MTTLAMLTRPRTWRQRVATRNRLAALTPRQLQDIGLTPELVAREVHKPFWHSVNAVLDEAQPDPAPREPRMPPALHHASRFAAVALPWRS